MPASYNKLSMDDFGALYQAKLRDLSRVTRGRYEQGLADTITECCSDTDTKLSHYMCNKLANSFLGSGALCQGYTESAIKGHTALQPERIKKIMNIVSETKGKLSSERFLWISAPVSDVKYHPGAGVAVENYNRNQKQYMDRCGDNGFTETHMATTEGRLRFDILKRGWEMEAFREQHIEDACTTEGNNNLSVTATTPNACEMDRDGQFHKACVSHPTLKDFENIVALTSLDLQNEISTLFSSKEIKSTMIASIIISGHGECPGGAGGISIVPLDREPTGITVQQIIQHVNKEFKACREKTGFPLETMLIFAQCHSYGFDVLDGKDADRKNDPEKDASLIHPGLTVVHLTEPERGVNVTFTDIGIGEAENLNLTDLNDKESDALK